MPAAEVHARGEGTAQRQEGLITHDALPFGRKRPLEWLHADHGGE